ncbi:hypothetical protein LguiB_011417 [Lonicera macranthoides]
MAIKSSNLMYFASVTGFFLSDVKFFSFPNGFCYNFHHHVVTKHFHFADIAKLPVKTEMEIIDPEKMLVVSDDDQYFQLNKDNAREEIKSIVNGSDSNSTRKKLVVDGDEVARGNKVNQGNFGNCGSNFIAHENPLFKGLTQIKNPI